MRCSICGAEVQTDEQRCFNCIEKDNKVQVLTPEEKQGFNGITLVQGQEQQGTEHGEFENDHMNQRVYSRQFNLVNTGFITKIVVGIVILGVVFVALPVVILAVSVISLIFYLFRK